MWEVLCKHLGTGGHPADALRLSWGSRRTLYKEHARENLLPAAWVALNRGADSVPTLRGWATSHLGQCREPGTNVFPTPKPFQWYQGRKLPREQGLCEAANPKAVSRVITAAVRACSFCRNVLTELPSVSVCHGS